MAARFPPLEPAVTEVRFPDPRKLAPGDPVVALGADFRPGTLLSAYRRGIFPWPQSRRVVAWCSMDPRAIFPLDKAPEFSRSLRRTLRKTPWTVRVDHDFRATMVACGANRPEGTWILPNLVTGYVQMHELGWAHSVEVYEGEALVGGIYGIAVGALFAGESMFHARTDASKVAFAHLAQRLYASGFTVFDVQVMNPHLESLGCIDVSRDRYLDLARDGVSQPNRRFPEALDPLSVSW